MPSSCVRSAARLYVGVTMETSGSYVIHMSIAIWPRLQSLAILGLLYGFELANGHGAPVHRWVQQCRSLACTQPNPLVTYRVRHGWTGTD